MSDFAKDPFNPTKEELLEVLVAMAEEVRDGKLLTIAFTLTTPDPNKQAVVYFGPSHVLAATGREIALALDPKGESLTGAIKKSLALVH